MMLPACGPPAAAAAAASSASVTPQTLTTACCGCRLSVGFAAGAAPAAAAAAAAVCARARQGCCPLRPHRAEAPDTGAAALQAAGIKFSASDMAAHYEADVRRPCHGISTLQTMSSVDLAVASAVWLRPSNVRHVLPLPAQDWSCCWLD